MSNAVSSGMATDSDSYWRNLEQGFIDDVWDNSTQKETILEQTDIGSSKYEQVEVWTATTLQISGTNYYKDSNQGMQFLFRDINKLHEPGVYYQWLKKDRNGNQYTSWWMSYFVHSNINYQSYSVCVRCDNELKFKDPADGKVYSWPCRVHNEATATNEQVTNYIITPHNKLNIVVQRNSQTERLFRLNRRFLIGGGGDNDNVRPFKIIALQNAHKLLALNDSTSGEQANILYLTLELDELHPQDDITNYIAYNADAEQYIEPSKDIIIEPAFEKIKKSIPVDFIVSCEGADHYSATPNAGSYISIVGDDTTGEYQITGEAIGTYFFTCVAYNSNDEEIARHQFEGRITSMIG